MEITNDILNASKAAEYLCISKGLLYKLCASHRLPYFKPAGKKSFFRKSELDKWLNAGRIATDAELQEKGGQNGNA